MDKTEDTKIQTISKPQPVDVSGLIPLMGKEKAEEYARRIEEERVEQYGRRIAELNEKRLEEAKNIAKQENITIEEALVKQGATIAPTIVERAKDIKAEAGWKVSPEGQKQQAEYKAAIKLIEEKAPNAIVNNSIIIESAIQAGINPSIIQKLGITPEQISKAKSNIATAQLVSRYYAKRTETEDKETEKFIKENYPSVYNIYQEKGAEEAINTYNNAVDKLNKFIVTIDTYENNKKVTRPAGRGDQIDLVAAHNAGLENEIKLIYGASILPDIMKAKSFDSSLNELKVSYNGDIVRAYVEGMNTDRLESLLESKDYNKVQSQYKDARNAFSLWKEKRNLTDKQWKELSNEERIAYSNASWTLITQYAPTVMAPTFQTYLNNTNNYLDSFPKVISIPGRIGVGAIMEAPYYALNMTLSAAGIATATNKAGYTKQVAGGVWDFFKSIPAQVKANPSSAANLAGVFLGAGRVIKRAKSAVARLDPWYSPNQGIRYTFTTGKIPTSVGEIGEAVKSGKITEVTVAKAIARAQRRFWKEPTKTAEARLSNTNIRIKIEPTPWNQKFGAVLWHATAEHKPFVGKNFVVNVTGSEPALFASLQAAPRFAVSTSSGVKATNPAMIMIYTKKGISFYPAAIEKAKTLNEMRSKGFQYLGSYKAESGAYPPIKEYLKRFENEDMLPNGMEIFRVKNFRSRIFGASAGEFVTVADGWVLPIHRFAEKGAKVPDIPISELAALRIDAILQSIKTMMGKKGFKAEAGYANTGVLARQLDTAARLAIRGVPAAQFDKAYREAIDREMVKRLNDIYKQSKRQIENQYRINPERFESAYLNRVSRQLAKLYNTRLIQGRAEIPNRIERNTVIEREITKNREDRLSRELNIIDRPARFDIDRIRTNITDRIIRDTPNRITVGRAKIKTPPKVVSSKSALTSAKTGKKKLYPITFRHGRIRGWVTIYPPYQSKADIKITKRAPRGAKNINGKSPYNTIQSLGGNSTILLTIDSGNQDITIRNPDSKPGGKKKEIRFRKDKGNKTRNQLTLTGIRAR